MLSIKITGANKAIADISSGFKKQLAQIATDLTRELKQKSPVASGKLKAGWTNNSKQGTIDINNRVPYSGFQERGTRKMRAANRGRGMVGPALNSIKGKY